VRSSPLWNPRSKHYGRKSRDRKLLIPNRGTESSGLVVNGVEYTTSYIPDQSFLFPKASQRTAVVIDTTNSISMCASPPPNTLTTRGGHIMSIAILSRTTADFRGVLS